MYILKNIYTLYIYTVYNLISATCKFYIIKVFYPFTDKYCYGLLIYIASLLNSGLCQKLMCNI